MKKFFIALLIVVLAGALAFCGIKLYPIVNNPIDEVNNSVYRQSMQIVYLSKTPVFETKLSKYYELATSEDKLKELFSKDDSVEQYRAKFEEIISKQEELTDEDKLFIDCAYATWYCEYMAKTASLNSSWLGDSDSAVVSTISSLLYGNSVADWRLYADTSFDMLKNADSVDDLNVLKNYLTKRDAELYF